MRGTTGRASPAKDRLPARRCNPVVLGSGALPDEILVNAVEPERFAEARGEYAGRLRMLYSRQRLRTGRSGGRVRPRGRPDYATTY
jgi:hypothetical protein